MSRSTRERKEVNYAALDNAMEREDREAKWIAVIKDRSFAENVVQYFETGAQATVQWTRTTGMRRPTIIKKKTVGLEVPKFDVKDVVKVIGDKYPVQVMKVYDQSDKDDWCLGDWLHYWESPSRTMVLNVISLEISKTKLSEKVRSPSFVRNIDWIDNAWPESLRARGEYPQTQYYCLMSAAGSYTDYHVDFGGTAVWYHIVKGRKIFLLTGPTKERLAIYEKWICDPKQDSQFFPDLLPDRDEATCKVELLPGQTLIIPSAWLHAVYTPEDSLVFGGNFLPGLSTVRDQLAVHSLETRARIHRKFRFPFFTSAMFFGLAHTYNRLTHQNDLTSTERDGLGALLDACRVWVLEPSCRIHANLAATEIGCTDADDLLTKTTDLFQPTRKVAKLKLTLPTVPPDDDDVPEDADDDDEEEEVPKLRLPSAWFEQTFEAAPPEAASEEPPPKAAKVSSTTSSRAPSTTTTSTKKKTPTTAMGRLKAKLGAPPSSKKRMR